MLEVKLINKRREVMNISKMKGLKYPDEFVIKFFFKENLHKIKGDVLELGCANGNNLIMFYQYGWNTVGIDLNQDSLSNGEYNF
jgi:SAM-dependent methyltransferase